MAKRRHAKANDIGVLKCIQDINKDKNILVQDENIKIDGMSISMNFLLDNKKMLLDAQKSRYESESWILIRIIVESWEEKKCESLNI